MIPEFSEAVKCERAHSEEMNVK